MDLERIEKLERWRDSARSYIILLFNIYIIYRLKPKVFFLFLKLIFGKPGLEIAIFPNVLFVVWAKWDDEKKVERFIAITIYNNNKEKSNRDPNFFF